MKNESILSQQVIFTGEEEGVPKQEFETEDRLEFGKNYTNLELIERLIQYSDNDALFLLGRDMSNEKINKVIDDLGVTKLNSPTEDNMSVKSYASIFRILYNASYLSEEYSEKALSILAGSSFDNGMRKGVPDNIEISHKFGQRDIEGMSLKQLHDCGIVYHPKSPYLLCIMTKGIDYDNLSNILGEISKMTYDSYTSSPAN